MKWLQDRLSDKRCAPYLIFERDIPTAHVRFEMENSEALISLNMAPERRGRGLGRKVLGIALERFRTDFRADIPIRAEIKEQNTASIKLFRSCGFELETETRVNRLAYILKPATGKVGEQE